MTSFKDFYIKSEKNADSGTENLPNTGTTQKIFSAVTLSATVNVLVQQTCLSVAGVLSGFGLDNTENINKFSEKVCNYATSDDVINSLSQQIGKPKVNETEQEFVERASGILREILNNKFNIKT